MARRVLFSLYFADTARLDPAECVADVEALRRAPAFRAACRAFSGWRFSGRLGEPRRDPASVATGGPCPR